MGLSILRLQDPLPRAPHGERRRRVRHRLHTPVYASFGEAQSGMVRDLSELIDIHEEGFAVQTSEPLEVNRPVTISLDLTEPRTYIHGTGYVVWCDGAGRGGIRFATLPRESQEVLRQWLFGNLLVACANHTARVGQRAQREDEDALPPVAQTESSSPSPVPDLSAILAGVEAARRDLRDRANDFDASLQLIADRALSLTGASGAALAFLSDDEMVCRARCGDPAPPLGARVDASEGFSGECVRSGCLLSCADTETDPRVDHSVCRALGIGSILAAPIVSNFRVVGLIEVFSPQRNAFSKIHEIALERLAEIVPKAPVSGPPPPVEPPQPESSGPAAAASSVPPAEPVLRASLPESQEEYPEKYPEEAPDLVGRDLAGSVPIRRSHIGLMAAAVAFAALALGYVLAPTIQRYWFPAQVAAGQRSPSASSGAAQNASPVFQFSTTSVEQLRKRAERSEDPEAQYELGLRYHSGDGVPQSDADAVLWFTRAADNGNVSAQGVLGANYWAGRGVPQDVSKAYFWSLLARAQGDEASKYRVAVLTSQLTRAQAAAIQQDAEAWVRQHARGAKPEGN